MCSDVSKGKAHIMIFSSTIKPLVFFGVLLSWTATAQNGPVLGQWRNDQFGYPMELQLNKDGTGVFEGEELRYVVKGSVLIVTIGDESTTYEFKQSGNRLALTGGDLEGQVIFLRASPTPGSKTSPRGSGPAFSATSKELVGLWSGNGDMIEFKADGKCVYGGNEFLYKVSQGYIIIDTTVGHATFQYALEGGNLTLTANGQRSTYTRPAGSSPLKPTSTANRNPQELVGQWCYMNMTSQSQTSRCITFYTDGTYVYSSEASRSVSSPELAGGTASQNGDRGTWFVDGDRIYYNSPTAGSGYYHLEKRNHPKNVNDPMIVLDGEPYVTTTQRPPWR